MWHTFKICLHTSQQDVYYTHYFRTKIELFDDQRKVHETQSNISNPIAGVTEISTQRLFLLRGKQVSLKCIARQRRKNKHRLTSVERNVLCRNLEQKNVDFSDQLPYIILDLECVQFDIILIPNV